MHFPVTDIGIADEAIVDLADDFESDEHIYKLGLALGFRNAFVERFLRTNTLQGAVTTKGTREMLFNWRQKALPENQAQTLKAALQKAGLNYLAHKHFPSISSERGEQIRERYQKGTEPYMQIRPNQWKPLRATLRFQSKRTRYIIQKNKNIYRVVHKERNEQGGPQELTRHVIIIIIIITYYLYRAFPMRPKALTIKFKKQIINAYM